MIVKSNKIIVNVNTSNQSTTTPTPVSMGVSWKKNHEVITSNPFLNDDSTNHEENYNVVYPLLQLNIPSNILKQKPTLLLKRYKPKNNTYNTNREPQNKPAKFYFQNNKHEENDTFKVRKNKIVLDPKNIDSIDFEFNKYIKYFMFSLEDNYPELKVTGLPKNTNGRHAYMYIQLSLVVSDIEIANKTLKVLYQINELDNRMVNVGYHHV